MGVSTNGVRLPISRDRVAAVAQAVLRSEHVGEALLSVTFVSNAAIRSLNRKHLKRAGVTDVISFGLGKVAAGAPVVGDVYIAPGVARGLKLRHDHGSNYMSGDFQDEIECLGIEASPSFVREPEGNGVAERFIRTLKENLLWVRTFDTIEELRAALVEFATRYNDTWLVARHGYRTPAQVRADQCRLDPNITADLKLAA